MNGQRKTRGLEMTVWILLAAFGLWIGGDVTYSKRVDHRLQKWEASVQRDENGVRLGTEAFSVGQGRPALLLIHGFGDSAALYRDMAPVLAESGYTCRAMRLPGFGEALPSYATVGNAVWLDAIEREVALLRREHTPVLIVAHSLGGTLALRYILEHPAGADGVVLLAPLIAVSNQRSPLLGARTWYRISRRMFTFQVMESPFPMNLRHAELRDYPRDRFIPRSIYDAMFETMSVLEKRAVEMDLPVLMMLAREDAVIDVQAARAYFEQMSSPSKRLVMLDDAGHAFPLDRGWEEVTAQIAAFAHEVAEGTR